jgi:dihydroorotase
MGFDSDLFGEGIEAELIVVDSDQEWTFSREHVQSRSINSPFYNKGLSGKVIHTISCGFITNN